MKRLSLIASALAVLLTACEKTLDVGEDVAPAGQAANSLLQVRTRASGSAADEAAVSYPVTVYVMQGDECRAVQTIGDNDERPWRRVESLHSQRKTLQNTSVDSGVLRHE